MIKSNQSKYTKSILLILSTLFCPLQIFGIILYFIPILYISIVVPYFIWKIWTGKNNKKIQIYSLFWKIPTILFIAFTMIYIEIFLLFTIFATETPLIGQIIIFILMLLLMRCIIYTMMIFIWQPDILKSNKIWAYTGIIIYCIANLYLIYSIENAPDIDDYNIPFSEQLKSQ